MDNIRELVHATQNITLLYVEDNSETRASTLVVLREFFQEIVVATNGEEGLAYYNTHPIDLIITDIKMPKMDGLEMSRAIREMDATIPIMILSAHNESDLFYASIQTHITCYLFKPLDITRFAHALSTIIANMTLKKELKKNEHLLEQYRAATDTIAIVSKTDPSGIITYANQNFCDISGYTHEALIGQNHNIVRDPTVDGDFYAQLWHRIQKEKKVWRGTIRNRRKNGEIYYVQSAITPIVDADGTIIEYMAVRYDITDVLHQKKHLDDALDAMKNPLVIYMKIENYQTLQELYRHEELRTIYTKLSKDITRYITPMCNFRKLYEMDHGEFVIAVEKEDVQYPMEDLIKKLKEMQEKIDPYIILSVVYEGGDVLDSAKLGIDEMVRTNKDFIIANNFLQKKKKHARENIRTLSSVKEAIEHYGIISYFQPIVNNKTRKIEKYESLVRLVDLQRNIFTPEHFLEIAKRGRYYLQISSIVLENSFAALTHTQHTEITINLSGLDIESKTLRMLIHALLEQYKADAHRIVFELLEDEEVKDFNTVFDFITHAKQYGVKIAIDDFGSGYSNYERLLDYQPDIVKIDGKLVKNILTDNYSASIIRSIVNFAKDQNLKTVAEHVETEAIFARLAELGIDYSQGYLFGKPRPLKEHILSEGALRK